MEKIAEEPRGRGDALRGRILVVDDDESLASLLHAELADLGYDVVMFTSPVEALQAAEHCTKRYMAVVTDEAMPGMSGASLVRRLRFTHPDIIAVVVTGCRSADLAARMQAAGIDSVLRKPVDMRVLATVLQRAMRRVSPTRR